MPIKVNIFAWRVRLNRLPSRVNLVARGVDVDSVICPCCEEEEEDINHLLFRCVLARQFWHRVAM